MSYTPYYPGGWKDWPDVSTPITAAALTHIEDGIGAGGGGAVDSVTAGDTSIVVGGTATDPTIETATLDVIATDHPPAANWSNNSKKITGLANGTASSDAAAFGQIPTSLEGNGDETLNVVASTGTTFTVNVANGATQDITLTSSPTLSFTSPASGSAWYMTLLLRQDATGSRTVTWPTITWLGTGVAPILQSAPSAVDSVVVFTDDGGSTWMGVAQTSASGLRAGTSFPGSPSDGDLFYRTDSRILYEYDSTSTHWLSMDRKYVPFNGEQLNGTTSVGTEGRVGIFEDIYVEKWVINTFTSTTNNGSNFYTYTLFKIAPPNTATSVTAVTTGSDTVASWTSHIASVGSVISAASFAVLSITSTKTGTPGNHFATHMLVVRSVG